MLNEGIRTFTANGAITAKQRVKLTAASTTSPVQVEVAGAGEQHIGIAEYGAASGAVVAVRLRTSPGTHEAIAREALAVGATLYGAATGGVKDTSDGTAIGIALEEATANGDIIEIIDFTIISTLASAISIADALSIITGVTVEAALAEIMTGIKTAQYTIAPTAMTLEDGTALTKFADGATGVGWTQLSSKDLALRWNDQATPDDIAVQFVMPQDYNDGADVIVHIPGTIVKAGVGVVDSPKVTVEAYFSEIGAAPGADINCGGDSTEFTLETYEEGTLTIALANAPAAPCVLTCIIHPKDGELGTDDFVMLTPWLEVTRKCLTS